MQVDNPDEIVMVHDGARPFIEQEHLHLLAETAQKQQAALLAVQVTDTIKQKNGNWCPFIGSIYIMGCSNTTSFSLSSNHKSTRVSSRAWFFLGTDDASLVEEYLPDQPVQIVEGSYQNVKLTTPEDIFRAEWILQKRGDL